MRNIAGIFGKIKTIEPFGIDINLGCPAPEIRRMGGGAELFDDYERLKKVLEGVRKHWRGLLTVKCRLGRRGNDWRTIFNDRMALFEDSGVDAAIVHPRFSDEKLKRRARWELFPWIASLTRLPIIANGDITSPGPARALLENGGCKGLMIGRMAAVKPWVFREFHGEPATIDYGDVWTRAFEYIMGDFSPEKAIGRIKEFSSYYARNFYYGHQFFKAIQGSPDLATIKSRGLDFLSREQEKEKIPSVMGL